MVFDTERNAFQMREIAHFFDIVDGKTENDNDMAHSLNVLRLAKGEIGWIYYLHYAAEPDPKAWKERTHVSSAATR